MKLAEALSEVKRLGALVSVLQTQFSENCIISNGVKPERDPEKLMAKLYGTIGDRHALDKAIQLTNAQVKLPCGLTIHGAILRKAELKSKLAVAGFMNNALRSGKRVSYGETVVKTYSIPPAQVEAVYNEAAKEIRQIESELQQTNWTQDVLGL